MSRAWNDTRGEYEFSAARDVEKGTELEVTYLGDRLSASERATRLKNYGI